MIFYAIIFCFSLLFASNSSHAMETFGIEKKLSDFATITALFEQHKTLLETFSDNLKKIQKIDKEYDTIVTHAPIEKLRTLEQCKLQLQQKNASLCMPFLGSLKELLDKNPGMFPTLHTRVESFLQTGQNTLDKISQVAV